MNKKKFEIDDTEFNFKYSKSKSNLNIEFNRISFIFFVFLFISIIFSIHLLHLGSRNNELIENPQNNTYTKKLYRADIIDRNKNYIVKTVSSINIGINPLLVIDKKKLLINLNNILPNKNFNKIEEKLNKYKFFLLEKKI